MRVERRLPKRRESVRVPDDLRAFLAEVQERAGRNEEETVVPSDDLLQDEHAYGGLIEGEGRRRVFGFTYFPEPGIRHKWELELPLVVLEMVAGGETTELELWSCAGPDCRSRFSASDDACFHCDYVDEP